MALLCPRPKVAYGQDVGPVRLEVEAESLAWMAGSGVGQTEAAGGQESRGGAACRQQASSQKRFQWFWIVFIITDLMWRCIKSGSQNLLFSVDSIICLNLLKDHSGHAFAPSSFPSSSFSSFSRRRINSTSSVNHL